MRNSNRDALINFRIIVRYPDCSIIDDDEYDADDSLMLIMPSMNIFPDTSHRHDPTIPLVQDPAVEAHAGRDNMQETGTFLLIPTEHSLYGIEHGFPNEADGFNGLLLDMRFAQTYIGETFLSMITWNVTVEGTDESQTWARVSRSTRYPKDRAGQPYTVMKEYDFDIVDLMNSDDQTTAADIAILQLIRSYLQSDDRAYRHAEVMANLTDWEIDCTTPKFRPSHHTADLLRALQFKLQPTDPKILAHPDTDTTCISCTDTWDSTTTIPITLACGHIVCKDCIINWASERGVATASCPMCRGKIFQDPLENQSILFGLTNGIYLHDDRYTAWENFERSCADLDLSSADNSTTWIVVNTDVLTGSWEYITQGAFLELADADSPEATFLNPLAFPEWRTVEQAVRHYFVKLSGAKFQVKELHKHLMHRVFDAFNLQFRQAGMDQFLTTEELNDLISKPMFLAEYTLGVRPGLRELLHRCLHRMLRLIEVRKCDCHHGFHGHGLRTYYNPASFTAPVFDHDGDIMME